MKYIFLIQGEGRGHMTQAIELAKILTKNGHEVAHAFIGKSRRRSVPEYFYKQLGTSIEELDSPNFILDKENKSLKLGKSIFYNARFLATYKKSLDTIHKKVKEVKPDVIVNFYDFLGGFYFRLYNPAKVKHVCIGRQFLTKHPDYPFAKGRKIEKKLYLTNNKLTSQKCDKYLALSFRPYEPARVKKATVVPPLLKSEVRELKPETGDFILGYMVNDGYAEEIMTWQAEHPDTEIHCFWDRKNKPETYSPQKNLTFHQINNTLFTEMMRKCKGYISTAGFESICEAMYLQKPIMMIPVDSQYEQACNAIDAEISGAGIQSATFDVSKLLKFISQFKPNEDFKQWAAQTERILLEELTNFD